jgi:hypothetical protein
MKTLLCILLLLSLSCNKNKNSDGSGSMDQSYRYLTDYRSTKNKDYLKKSYCELNKSALYKKDGLTNSNYELVVPLLVYLKKYDELLVLISNSSTIELSKKDLIINMVNSLKFYQKDKVLARKYIDKNLKFIKERINQNPKDSLNYIDYFIMKLYVKDRETVFKEIDSMQLVNKNFSNQFFKYILKDAVHDYPQEYLYN